MLVSLTITRYPKPYLFFALLSMAVHRLPFWFNKSVSFYKLMGSGKNGTFDKHPDWQQWAILAVHKTSNDFEALTKENVIAQLYGGFINRWISFFNCETWTLLLQPIEGHGLWDGKTVFGHLPKQIDYEGPITVLTRATIRLSKLGAFWRNVPGSADQLSFAPGFINSFGIGELPFIKQATVSTWQSRDAMIQFAYQVGQHSEVIRKTREGNWYSEEMFIRFKPLKTIGTIKGSDPLQGKL